MFLKCLSKSYSLLKLPFKLLRYGHLTALNRIPDQSFNLDFQEVVRMMLAHTNGPDTKDDLLINNIIGTTLYDYFEGGNNFFFYR